MKLEAWKHFLRPNLWIYILAIYLLGFFLSGAGLSSLFVVGAVVFVLINTASITVNHYFDCETDKMSTQKRFPVAQGDITKQTAAGFSVVVMMVSLLLSLLFPPIAVLLVIFSLFMIVAYSAPPLRIKELPFLDTFWNGLGYGTVPYYLSLLIFQVPVSLEVHILGLIPFFIAASGHILLQIRDIDADRRSQVKTSSTILGMKTMVTLSKGMIGIAGVSLLYLTIIGFLNTLAWISIATGIAIAYQHRRMKSAVTHTYPVLKLLYVVGGVSFLFSVL